MTYYNILQERLNSITNPVKPMRPKVPGIDSSSCEFLAYSNELAKHEELEQNYKKELKEFEILRQLAYSDFKKSHRSDYPELSEKQFDLVYDKVSSDSEMHNYGSDIEELVKLIELIVMFSSFNSFKFRY